MQHALCPKCQSEDVVKSGFIEKRQRFKCKSCGYHFTVFKDGKKYDKNIVIKSLQLYLEGLSFREIERLVNVSHVTISRWVKEYGIKRLHPEDYKPHYRIVSHTEMLNFLSKQERLNNRGFIISTVNSKYLIINFERIQKD